MKAKMNKDNNCFAVKSKNGLYFCGYNKWDSQLRKAKLYHWYSMAEEIAQDNRFIQYKPYIVHVTIIEDNIIDSNK